MISVSFSTHSFPRKAGNCVWLHHYWRDTPPPRSIVSLTRARSAFIVSRQGSRTRQFTFKALQRRLSTCLRLRCQALVHIDQSSRCPWRTSIQRHTGITPQVKIIQWLSCVLVSFLTESFLQLSSKYKVQNEFKLDVECNRHCSRINVHV